MSSVGDAAQDTPQGNAAGSVGSSEVTEPQTAQATEPQTAQAFEPQTAAATPRPAPQSAEQQDNYLEALQRLKAEFDNYRRRVREQQNESAEKATAALVEKLLPVVDACEAALSLSVFGSDAAVAGSNIVAPHDTSPGMAATNPATNTAGGTAAPGTTAPTSTTAPGTTAATNTAPAGTTAPANTAAATGRGGSDYLEHEHQGLVKLAELLFSTLQEHGLTALRPEGQEFDPNCHEAIEHSPIGDGEISTSGPVVKEVVRTGYVWRDQLLRPAMVKVKG